MNNRSKRVADLLQQEIATALTQTISDPRLRGLVITGVDLSSDLRNAKVYYVLQDQTQQTQVTKALDKAKGFLRHLIADNTELRYVPTLTFMFDETFLRADQIDKLIRQKPLREDQD